MTNLLEKGTDKPIANCGRTHVLQSQGMKIGFVGMAEEPWLDALDTCIDVDQIEYVDFNESLRTNSQMLRQ